MGFDPRQLQSLLLTTMLHCLSCSCSLPKNQENLKSLFIVGGIKGAMLTDSATPYISCRRWEVEDSILRFSQRRGSTPHGLYFNFLIFYDSHLGRHLFHSLSLVTTPYSFKPNLLLPTGGGQHTACCPSDFSPMVPAVHVCSVLPGSGGRLGPRSVNKGQCKSLLQLEPWKL